MGKQNKNAVRPTPMVRCPYCDSDAELVGGEAIYPHRPDLANLKFWQCAPCEAYVGCHKPNAKMGYDGTQPLGRLADAELRRAKWDAHSAFDPLWRDDGPMRRRDAYAWLAKGLGIAFEDCHIGEFDVAMCKRVVSLSRSYFGAAR